MKNETRTVPIRPILQVFERDKFDDLFAALRRRGYRLVGPTVQDGAIVYDELGSTDDLPEGWTDEQEAGTYRLHRRDDAALFGYVVGPHSWKKYLHPPMEKLWQARREGAELRVTAEIGDAPRYAFIGVRPCELAAIAIQDRVFLSGSYVDAGYQTRREAAFVVAVNCGQAGGACFCVSMNAGPKVEVGFDLALTEVIESGHHYFVAEAATRRAFELLDDVETREATGEEIASAVRATKQAVEQMGRMLDTSDVQGLLQRNREHPRWDEVATRCLTCANCTMVCPTCFCTTVEDVTDLTGEHAERWRRWDSCFTLDFTHLHGGSVRASARSRYRQWLMHKLSMWFDQFGTSGCVGCGRCITWCPEGIDITEEVRAMRESEARDEGDS